MIEAVTSEQRKALESLATVVDPETYLAGGVAIALRLAHRSSRDLDLFTTADPTTHAEALANPRLQTTIVGRSDGSLQLEVNGVPASWLRYRYPMLSPPERIANIPIPIVSVDDAACMKISAIAGRGAPRDFWDPRGLPPTAFASIKADFETRVRKL